MPNNDDDAPPPKTGNVNVKDLVPCIACCCFIFSCYTEVPDCCGSVCVQTCLCCDNTTLLCKPSKEAGVLCKCCAIECNVIPFTSCCKSRSQAFCLDIRASLPPSEEIPCLITLCCITLFYNYSCLCTCASEIREIHKKARGKSTGVATEDFDNPWEAVVDPNTKKVYYVNYKTGASQWEKPSEMNQGGN